MSLKRWKSAYKLAKRWGIADALYGKPIDHDSENGRKLDAAIAEAERDKVKQ